ncbi:hypothetical protein SA496_15685 [Pseudomonas sp. JS3066]|uniref:hypothetical protein n=1 Tax=Pseudomonas sp. JS3066 TaxID=3090665 RepID=UPI002E7C22C8|nr:hypothetical protein [Pseudomonas sp. JS3066]WVK91170.1 hypothetical protein SA496_15685 [Pseudomonas sp. JS3066]
MAKTQWERDQDAAEKRKELGEVELRHRVIKGTNAALAELMLWHGFSQKAEAIQILIINTHALGPEFSGAVAAAASQCPREAVEDLRHRLRPGTRAMLNDIAQWRGITNLAQVVEQLIHETHMLGQQHSAHRVRVPRHEFTVSENVAQWIHAKGISQCRLEDLQEARAEWRD